MPPVCLDGFDYVAALDESGSGINAPGRHPGDSFAFGTVLAPVRTASDASDAGKRLREKTRTSDPKYSDVAGSSAARGYFIDVIRSTRLGLRFTGTYVGGAGVVQEAFRQFRMGPRNGDGLLDLYRSAVLSQDRPSGPRLHAIVQSAVFRLAAFAAANNQRVLLCFDRRTDIGSVLSSAEQLRDLLGSVPELKQLASLVTIRDDLGPDLRGLFRLADVVAGDVREFFAARGEIIWPTLNREGLQIRADQVRALGPQLAADASFGFRKTFRIPLVPKASPCMLQSYHRSLADGLLPFLSPDGIGADIKIEHGSLWSVLQHPEVDHRP